MLKDTTRESEKQESGEKSREVMDLCVRFLEPLMKRLNQGMDRRLVNTLRDLVMLIVIHRHRNQGLVMSELGGELVGEKHAPAGYKRIWNLLHSGRWQTRQIEEELWQQGDGKVEQLKHSNEEALVLWDESENEKPESLAAEGLCAVRSSKAARLKRIKPGFFNPPGGRPIFVPGFHWIQVVVTGMKGAPRLAHLHWWTNRGEQKSDKRSEEGKIFQRIARAWGSRVVHVFDQGFAGSPWVETLLQSPPVLFVLRWNKSYKLVGKNGQADLAWKLLRGKRSMDHKEIWDAPRRCKRSGLFLSR
jgi:hypothetical protein